MKGTCENCGMPATRYTGRCGACYIYYYRRGRERPAHLCNPQLKRACTRCGWQEKNLRRGLCHSCAMKKTRQTKKLRRLVNQINIKSILAIDIGLLSPPLSARLVADSWQPGVANRDDIKLGRINAN